MLEQFAKSHHGKEIYHLQDNGIPLAQSQAEIVPIQKNVYLLAKSYWSAKEHEQSKDDVDTPSV